MSEDRTDDPSDERHLREACRLAVASVHDDGGPFGAVIARGAAAIAQGTNRVTAVHDPTAHAEMEAIRSAARALGRHDLSGHTLYASCHPCPMCLAAAWWARLDRIVYAATADDAARADFDDGRFWRAMADPAAAPVVAEHLEVPNALAPFDAWRSYERRRPY